MGLLCLPMTTFGHEGGSRPVRVAEDFGTGFWDLTAFTLQLAMVVLTGHIVTTRFRRSPHFL